MKNKLKMLVNSCDAYDDLWEMFYRAIDEYWLDRDVDVLINTENKIDIGFDAEGLSLHNSSASSWGARLIETINDIEQDYILMVCDDFILEDYVDSSNFEKIISWLDKDESISVFYLEDLFLSSEDDGRFENYRLIDHKSDFRLNTAPAIWRKSHLLDYTKQIDNPWAWEVFGTYRTQKTNRKFYQLSNCKYYDFNGKKGGAIYRGKWVEDVVLDKKEKYGLEIDFAKRGFSSDSAAEKRPFLWKVNFIYIGYKMIGLDVFKYIFRYLKIKVLNDG